MMNHSAKFIIGMLLIIAVAAIGIYVGIWVCFVGGIVDVITQVRAEHLSALSLALGVAKIGLAGFFGWLSAIVLVAPGYMMVND